MLWFGDANTMVHQNQTLLPRFWLKMWSIWEIILRFQDGARSSARISPRARLRVLGFKPWFQLFADADAGREDKSDSSSDEGERTVWRWVRRRVGSWRKRVLGVWQHHREGWAGQPQLAVHYENPTGRYLSLSWRARVLKRKSSSMLKQVQLLIISDKATPVMLVYFCPVKAVSHKTQNVYIFALLWYFGARQFCDKFTLWNCVKYSGMLLNSFEIIIVLFVCTYQCKWGNWKNFLCNRNICLPLCFRKYRSIFLMYYMMVTEIQVHHSCMLKMKLTFCILKIHSLEDSFKNKAQMAMEFVYF